MYAHLYVLDRGAIVEVHPASGERLQMSATAIEALRRQPGKLIRESDLSFNSELK